MPTLVVVMRKRPFVDLNLNNHGRNGRMSFSKQRLRALYAGLLAVLGLMAFFAASAQALTGWLLNQMFITQTKRTEAVTHPLVGGTKHTGLEVEFPGIGKVEYLCETLTSDDGLIFANEKAEGLITFLYSKCKVFIKGVEKSGCRPKEPITLGAKLRAILHTVSPIVGEKEGTHDNKTYLLFEPEESGKPFGVIRPGGACVIMEELGITGDFVVECLNEKLEKNTLNADYCLEDMVHHLIQEAPHKLFTLTGTLPEEEKWDELLIGGRLASLLGITDLRLSDASNVELTWAVHI